MFGGAKVFSVLKVVSYYLGSLKGFSHASPDILSAQVRQASSIGASNRQAQWPLHLPRTQASRGEDVHV